jgi:hypothetical protein
LTEVSTSGAQQMVQDKAQEAKEQVKQTTGSAQDRIREQVDTRSTEAGHRIDSVGHAIRTASQQLKGQGNEPGICRSVSLSSSSPRRPACWSGRRSSWRKPR